MLISDFRLVNKSEGGGLMLISDFRLVNKSEGGGVNVDLRL